MISEINSLTHNKLNSFYSIIHSWRGKLNSENKTLFLFCITLKKLGFSTQNFENFNDPSAAILNYFDSKKHTPDSRVETILNSFIPSIDTFKVNDWIEFFNAVDDFLKRGNNLDYLTLFDLFLVDILENFGKYSVEFLLPNEISSLMLKLANANSNSKIYNPFAGAVSFGVNNENFNYVGQEINKSIWEIGLMRLIVSDSPSNKVLLLDDSINNWNPNRVNNDAVIAAPPFNMALDEKIEGKWGIHSKVESFFIEKSLESINENGKVIMIIPDGFLSNKSNTFSNLRDDLIDNDLLEMIISLPSGFLKKTAIKTSILVINKAKSEKGVVKFVKSEAFIKSQNKMKVLDEEALWQELTATNSQSIKTVSNAVIKLNENLLNVNRFFLEEINNGIKLNEILTPYNGSRISEQTLYKIVSLKDIQESNLNLSTLEIRNDYSKTFFRKIEESCLLIAPGATYLKATWFEFTGEPILVKNNIKAFKVDKNKVDKSYLIHQFHEDYCIKQMEAFAIGSVISLMNVQDILKLEIHLPSLIEQKDWVNKKFLKSLDSEKDKVDFLRKQFNDELGSKQHNIRQHLKNVKDSLDVLISCMAKNNGTLKKDDIINPKSGITVSKRIESLQTSLNNVIFEVNNLTNENNFGPVENIDLLHIIKETINEHVTSNYEIVLEIDELGLKEIDDSKLIIQFSKNDLKEVINNVIENAVNHGFIDKTKQYKLLIYVGIENNKIILQMVNNGIPLPKEVSKSFGIKGVKAGKTGNKGIGVWKIIQAMQHFGHEYYIVDEPEDEFPAGWVFKFNINN